MTRRWGVAVMAVLCVFSAPERLLAQTSGAPATRLTEVHVRAGWLGGGSLGTAEANLRTATGQPFVLFTTDRSFGSTTSVSAGAAFPWTGRLALEGAFTWGRPDVRAAVASDAEGAAPITATERVSQFFFEGTVLASLDEMRVGRLVPFVAGGGGYLRELQADRTLVEHGLVFHAGGGTRYWLSDRAGLRADVRAYFLRGGVSDGSDPRPRMAVSGGFFVGF
jgi:hypothetical protein